jgi:hypothetical protein
MDGGLFCILSLEGEYVGVKDLEGKKPSRDSRYTNKYTLTSPQS